METTQNDRLLPIDEILNLSLEEIKEDLDENAKESQIILSCVVLASRGVMKKNKTSVLYKKFYSEEGKSSILQDEKLIDQRTIDLATDSLTWFGEVSGISNLYELLDLSTDSQHFINLLQKHIGRGVTYKERNDINRSYVDNEIKKLEKVLESKQECFHKEVGEDKIICKKCNNYEPRLQERAEKLKKSKEPTRELQLKKELEKELFKVPRNRQNPKSQNRTPIYGGKELIDLVVKACALTFPSLSFKLLKEIIYKILANHENSAPISMEALKGEDGNTDYFEFISESIDGINPEDQLKAIESIDYDMNNLIKELTHEEHAALASTMGVAFDTNPKLGKYLSKSAEYARTLKKHTEEKLQQMLDDYKDDDIFQKEFGRTIRNHLQDIFKEER